MVCRLGITLRNHEYPLLTLKLLSQICSDLDVLSTKHETRLQSSTIANPVPVEPGTFIPSGQLNQPTQNFKAQEKTQTHEVSASVSLPSLEVLFPQDHSSPSRPVAKKAEARRQIQGRAGTLNQLQTQLRDAKRLPASSQNLRSRLEHIMPPGGKDSKNQMGSHNVLSANTPQKHHRAPYKSCDPCRKVEKFCSGGSPCGRCRWTMQKCYYADM